MNPAAPVSVRAIHQFSQATSPGDGVTNSLLFTRQLLRGLGFESEIFADHIPPALAAEVRPRDALLREPDCRVLVHHALGYDDDRWLSALAGRAILVYHNITPEALLPEAGPWRRLSRLGRRQLVDWQSWLVGAIGVSEYNVAELREVGFDDARVLSSLVDVRAIRSAPWDPAVLARYQDSTNVLFVGRLAPNKRHDLLLESFAEYLHFTDRPSCLILPGSPVSREFLDGLRARAAALGIERHVDFLGPVSDRVLGGLYRAADLFLCASDHEGFGMPLIEASVFGVPVIARATSNVPNTLGEGGLLVRGETPREIGALMHTVLAEPALRRRMLAGQQANLARFDPDRLAVELADYLASLGLRVPRPPSPPSAARPLWRIDGPFDSSYSLAVVNRETARALSRQGQPTALALTPGTDAPPPDPAFLEADPEAAAMVELASRPAPVDVALRFEFPPTTIAMGARVRVAHGYGWEETAFPARYVDWMNRRLDLVTVLSRETGKILRDAGLRLPVAVVGAGIDHLAALPDEEPPVALGKAYRFLHLSSCFPRKGVDVLLAAYGRAFRADDDVSLVVKTFPNPHNDVARQLAALRAADPGYPDVVLIEEDWSAAAVAGLYRRCHALVAPSRGEGFGLPLAEAMSFGLPVITTGWGGQTDFCTAETAWLIDWRFAPARTHLRVEHSAWAEPDVGHLAALLREVRDATPAQLAPRIEAACARVRERFGWARVATLTRDAVAALDRAPTLRVEPRIGWVSSWNSRCGIAGYSARLSAAIPADRLQVFAPVNAEPAGPDAPNVTRCWVSGVMDAPSDPDLPGPPAEPDDLIHTLRTAPLDALVIQYNYGFFSPARLGRIIADSHALGRQVHVFLHATEDIDLPDFKASLRDIVDELRQADRVYVHGIADLERLRAMGVVANSTLFPHGIPDLRSEPGLLAGEGQTGVDAPAPSAPKPPSDAATVDPLSPKTLRAQAGIGERRVIASYGFLLPHKGVPQLVEAFAAMQPQRDNLHLVLACALYPAEVSSQEKAAVEALVERLGLADRVTLLTDFLPDAQSLAWLRIADLVVFPYQRTQESSSAAVRMGLASRRPVAVTPLSIFDDVAEVVHRLPGTSPEAIATGLAALLADPARCRELQERAARHVEARAWPRVASRLRDLIDGLANPLPT